MKELSPITPFKGPNDEGGATPGHADEFNKRNSELMKRDEELLEELNSSNAQTAKLSHGLNIVESDQSSIADVLIEGRTMVNLINYKDTEYVVGAGEGTLYREKGLYGEAWGVKVTPGITTNGHLQFYPRNQSNFFLKAGKKYLIGAFLYVKEFGAGDLTPKISLRPRGNRGQTLSHGTSITELKKWTLSRILYTPDEDVECFVQGEILWAKETGEFLFDGCFAYELTESAYSEALTLSNEKLLLKYPYVEGIKHLSNPILTSKGRNLLKEPWVLGNIGVTVGRITTGGNLGEANVFGTCVETIPVIPGERYVLSLEEHSATMVVVVLDDTLNVVGDYLSVSLGKSFVVPLRGRYLRIRTISTNPDLVTPFLETGAKIQLTMSENKLPYEKYNEKFLYTSATLGSSLDGFVKDHIIFKDGKYVQIDRFKKDVFVDGSFNWEPGGIYTDTQSRQFRVFNIFSDSSKTQSDANYAIVIDSKNRLFQSIPSGMSKEYQCVVRNDGLHVSLPNSETGWTNNPTVSEIKEYFNNNPLKVTYLYDKPLETSLDFEGAISVNRGKNLLEVDSGLKIREFIVPKSYTVSGISYHGINYKGLAGFNGSTSPLAYETKKIIKIYKDGVDETSKWTTVSTNNSDISSNAAFGLDYARIRSDQFDTSAEYTVTYIMLDKHQFSTNIDKASVTYQTSLKASHDKSVQQITANTSEISTLNLMMGEIIKLFRIMGGE